MTPPQLANERVALYRRVLGEAWDSLPEPLRAMHDLDGERSADGVAVVERGSGLLARLVAFVIGLPPAAANIPVTVSFRVRHGREHWQRNFAGRVFSSVQAQGRGRSERLLCERFGPLNFVMALVARANACGSWSAAGACAGFRCRARWRRAETRTSSRRRSVSIFTWRSPIPSPG
jgi:hypothetical protein